MAKTRKRKTKFSLKRVVKGAGIVNSIIDKLPIELHLPGYQFCGPGTKLQARLNRGDTGINGLDKACKDHDIAYSKFKNTSDRNIADKILAEKAWQRVKAVDSSLTERAHAYLVTNAMKLKVKTGMGIKRYKNNIKKKSNKKKTKSKKPKSNKKNNAISYKVAMTKAIKALKTSPKNLNFQDSVGIALQGARSAVKGKRRFTRTPRIIPVPKTGGILPFLLPLFAGLSAVGSIAGGVSAVSKAVTAANNAKNQLAENVRHNQRMEGIAVGKGLYMKPYKQGLGLYLLPYQKNY